MLSTVVDSIEDQIERQEADKDILLDRNIFKVIFEELALIKKAMDLPLKLLLWSMPMK